MNQSYFDKILSKVGRFGGVHSAINDRNFDKKGQLRKNDHPEKLEWNQHLGVID